MICQKCGAHSPGHFAIPYLILFACLLAVEVASLTIMHGLTVPAWTVLFPQALGGAVAICAPAVILSHAMTGKERRLITCIGLAVGFRLLAFLAASWRYWPES